MKTLLIAIASIALTVGCSATRPYASSRPTTISAPVVVNGDATVNGNLRVNGVISTTQPIVQPAPVTPVSQRQVTALPAPTAPVVRSTAGANELELKKETAATSKQIVHSGEVRVRKIVTSQTVTLPVDLNHEEAIVERVPASGQPATPFEAGEIFVPLNRETATVTITPVVSEIVRIRKVQVTTTTNLTGVIRSESIQVQQPTP